MSVRFCVSWGPLALHTLYAAVYGVGSLLATSDAVRAAGESGGRGRDVLKRRYWDRTGLKDMAVTAV